MTASSGEEERAGQRRFEIRSPDWRPITGPPLAGDRKSRWEWFNDWRDRCFELLSAREGRTIKIAILIRDTAQRDGFSIASDGWIAKKTAVAQQHIAGALRQLEEAGLIERCHVGNGPKQTQRRIWLTLALGASKADPAPVTGVTPYSREGGKAYSRDGGTEYIKRQKSGSNERKPQASSRAPSTRELSWMQADQDAAARRRAALEIDD